MIPIMLITPGRSGGSILVKALALHPSILVCGKWPYEQRPAGILMRLYQMISISDPSEKIKSNSFRGNIYDNGRSPFIIKNNEQQEEALYRQCVVDKLGRNFKQAAQEFYSELKSLYNKPDANFFIEKLGIPESISFRELYYHPRTIFLIRDPRDAVVSMSKWTEKINNQKIFGNERTMEEIKSSAYGKSWEKMANEINKYKKEGFQHLVVRYEDLMTKTESTVSKILEYIGVSAEDLICDKIVDIIGKRENHHVTSNSTLSSIARWETLGSSDCDILNKHFGPVAHSLGYTSKKKAPKPKTKKKAPKPKTKKKAPKRKVYKKNQKKIAGQPSK
jgi:Sulfotransferase domain